MIIDGTVLVDGATRISFDPAEVVKDLAALYEFFLSVSDGPPGEQGPFSAIFLERTGILLSRDQLGGIYQLYQARGELPRALLERWYEYKWQEYAKTLSEAAA